MKRIHLLWNCCVLTLAVCAQTENAGVRTAIYNTANITCYFDGAKDGDTARVEIWKHNIRTTEMRSITWVLIKNNEIKLNIDSISHPLYFSIFYKQRSQFHPVVYLTNPVLCLVEARDNIRINCSKDNMVFSGRGAAKLQCKYEMDQLKNKTFREWPSRNSKDYINGVYDFLGESLAAKMNYINSYKKKISKTAYEILRVDAFGQDMITRLIFFEANIIRNYGTTEQYYRNYQRFTKASSSFPVKEDIKNLYYSFYYTNFLMRKLIVDSFINQSKSFNLANGCQQVKRKYTGILKEKLLTMLIERYRDSSDAIDCLKDGIVEVKNPELNSVLRKLYKNKQTGKPVFEFSFRDTTGKLYRVSDFKNKVVLLDFWFTGCLACRSTSLAMKPIEDLFKDNKDVVFISISIDTNRAMWIKSIPWYSSWNRINLYTDSRGGQDPFLDYYDIYGFPTLMLVDRKGNLFSYAVPNPLRDKTGEGMISQIKLALSQ